MSRQDLNKLENKLDARIKELKQDFRKLDTTAGFENIAVENFDYVPIVQEVIKGDEEDTR